MELKVPIIYYHSVGKKNTKWSHSFLTLELPYFEEQLKYFSKRYNVISLKEYWEMCNNLKPVVNSPLVLTFDDGYLDNWIWAYPLLKKYNIRATIFVSPEFVDPRNFVRPNIEDVWEGRATFKELDQWGYLSWPEMMEMEKSGIISIESHTMSHTKYPCSDILTGFHNGNITGFYTICNQYPERKPYYIEDSNFYKLLPDGYPLFEEKSSVICKRRSISPDFVNTIMDEYDKMRHKSIHQSQMKGRLLNIYRYWKAKDQIINGIETEEEYQYRLEYEIAQSKDVIESKLQKTVEFLCWPHGDQNRQAHETAMKAGYLATSIGSKSKNDFNKFDRIPERIGLSAMRCSRNLTRIRMKYKLNSFRGKFPWKQLKKSYEFVRYGK